MFPKRRVIKPLTRAKILEYVVREKEATRSQTAKALDITYDTARYWLERLVEDGIHERVQEWIIPEKVFRWKYKAKIKREEVNLYIVIEQGDKKYSSGTRRYPSGAFQGRYQHDSPLDRVLAIIKEDFVDIVAEWFHVFFESGDITVGISNVIPNQSEIGMPVKRVSIERTVDLPVLEGYSPKRDWQRSLGEFL